MYVCVRGDSRSASLLFVLVLESIVDWCVYEFLAIVDVLYYVLDLCSHFIAREDMCTFSPPCTQRKKYRRMREMNREKQQRRRRGESVRNPSRQEHLVGLERKGKEKIKHSHPSIQWGVMV